jgi:hypothetical protein
MTHYIGLDAHSKTCTAVVMNSAGKLVSQAKFYTSERNLIDFMKSVKSPRKLAFEEQNLAHWLFVTLKDQVDQLVVMFVRNLDGANFYSFPDIDAIKNSCSASAGDR